MLSVWFHSCIKTGFVRHRCQRSNCTSSCEHFKIASKRELFVASNKWLVFCVLDARDVYGVCRQLYPQTAALFDGSSRVSRNWRCMIVFAFPKNARRASGRPKLSSTCAYIIGSMIITRSRTTSKSIPNRKKTRRSSGKRLHRYLWQARSTLPRLSCLHRQSIFSHSNTIKLSHRASNLWEKCSATITRLWGT